MKHRKSALVGLHDDKHRDQVDRLVEQGWSVDKTGGGHLKLVHPDAPKPIFTASTPSCPFAAHQLRQKAARMLNSAAAPIVTTADTTPVSGMPEMKSDAILPAKKRKDRWSEGKREKRDKAVVARLMKACETPKISNEGQTCQKQSASPEQTAPVQPEIARGPQIQVITPAPAGSPAVDRLETIDRAVLEMAFRLMRGDLRPLEITADMVGQVLWVPAEGETILTPAGLHFDVMAPDARTNEAGGSAVQIPGLQELQTKGPVPQPVTESATLDPGRSEVLALLRATGSPMLAADVARNFAKINNVAYNNSLTETLRHRLRRLVESGHATVARGERNRMLYSAS